MEGASLPTPDLKTNIASILIYSICPASTEPVNSQENETQALPLRNAQEFMVTFNLPHREGAKFHPPIHYLNWMHLVSEQPE